MPWCAASLYIVKARYQRSPLEVVLGPLGVKGLSQDVVGLVVSGGALGILDVLLGKGSA